MLGSAPLRLAFLAALLACVVAVPAPKSCGTTLASAAGTLPVAKSKSLCGAGLAICPNDECCSQYGRCRPGICESTCQCEFSGKHSLCPGSTNLTNLGVPVAHPGAICGPGVATCPAGQCCSSYGFCGTSAADCAPGCYIASSGMHSDCNTPTNTSTVKYELTLKWKNTAPDGFSRPTIVINGATPGPTLRCNVGDRIIIKVNNNLPQPMSIHWHGILQRGTVSQDGVAGVTQRALPGRASQLYDFICILEGDYWYHSHFKGQYMDGLRGALIISDKTKPQPPADSIMQLTDWFHEKSDDLQKVYLSPKNEEGAEPVPISATMNGIGQGNCTGSRCNYPVLPAVTGTCAEAKTQIAIINGAGFAVFTVAIDGHSMVVLAVDAVPIHPSPPLKAIRINTGQRYRVAVCRDPGTDAKSTAPAWIRAAMQQSVFATDAPDPLVLGVLQYGPVTVKPRALPTTQPDHYPLNELLNDNLPGSTNPYSFRPISDATPPRATMTIPLRIDFFNDPTPTSTVYAHFNNVSMQLPAEGGPSAPSLLEILMANKPVPPAKDMSYHTISLPEGSVVDLVINNHDTGEHPLHLHGHWFWVMYRALPDTPFYDPNKDALDDTPLLRDTATVNANSSLVLRFVASNPGAWIFHCHIDFHLEAGLALVFRYGVGI